MFALRRATASRSVFATRSLHASPSVAKRAKVQEQEDFEEVELDDDLFSTAGGSVGSSSRAEQRAEHVAAVLGRTAERVGTLRKVVQLSDSAADLEQLDSVLRAWRVAKHRVTNQTGQELVGRCINLGRPDLAQKFVADRLTYGVPAPNASTVARLEKALAEFAQNTEKAAEPAAEA